MNTRSSADGPSGENLRHLRRLLNLTFSSGSHSGKKGGSVTGGVLPAPDGTYRGIRSPSAAAGDFRNLLDFLDPFSRPISASEEVYGDGGGI